MTVTFEDQVAIVTGAARGLGRGYARALAARGARVVIADLGPEAEKTAAEIRGEGGVAKAAEVDVTDFASVERMVQGALAEWGRIDVVINNAGILRDKSFAKMELADFRAVLDVHVMGSVNVCKAVWEPMRERQYGRILLTGSSSGMYGIFGQANYGAAKAAMLGLTNALHFEGHRYDIRVNMITPAAATRMTEGLLTPEAEQLLVPEAVAPGALFLVSRDAPSKTILAAGGGTFARIYVAETEGVSLVGDALTPENVAARFAEISDISTAREVADGHGQAQKLASASARAVTSAMAGKG